MGVLYIEVMCGCVLTESKLVAFWNLIGDADKQIFSSDKFLAQASNDGEYLYCWTLTGLLDSGKTYLWGNFFKHIHYFFQGC